MYAYFVQPKVTHLPPKKFLDRLARLAVLSAADVDIVVALPWAGFEARRSRDFLKVGDKPDYLYVVEDGWAARYTVRADGSRRITGFMLPGDFCGIHAVTNKAIEHALVAIANCRLARVPRTEIKEAIARSPRLNDAFWHAKLIDEAILRAWLAHSKDAEQSLAHLICELHARVAANNDVVDGHFCAPLSQEQLGDALGLTAVHVNRMVRQLRDRGLADFTLREVVIPDIGALRRACSFTPEYLHGLGG